MEWDFIIVGGGSAGCVLANRLSADPSRRVLLLEAGRDTPPDRVPPEVLDSYPRVAYFDVRNLWKDLRVRLTENTRDPPRRYEQARIMGGGSSLNDMQANRGMAVDYDDWAKGGATGWAWRDVLPYFRRLERDLDFPGSQLHGDTGPLPIRRIWPEVWPGFSKAAAESFKAQGLPFVEDHNGDFRDGYFPLAISNLYDRRVSTAIAYLDHATRKRPNLRIESDVTVERLLRDGRRIAGVRAIRGGAVQEWRARTVVVCAGALHSPTFLLRAGIGPGAELQKLGIEVAADRPGVGKNLQEHPAISISGYIAPEARLPRSLRRHIHVSMRYTSGLVPGLPQDMQMIAITKTGWHPVGERIGTLMVWVNRSFSTGAVTLASPEPQTEPNVDFRLLSDERDAVRLIDGMRRVAKFLEHPDFRAAMPDIFPSSYSERIRDLGRVTTKNRALTTILAALLDGPPAVRRAMIRHVITEGEPVDALMADAEKLARFVRGKVHGLWHACGSCRMGAKDDPMAVVDTNARVIGVDGLCVVDASVMPCAPRGNTNLPTIMIAEKTADAILAHR